MMVIVLAIIVLTLNSFMPGNSFASVESFNWAGNPGEKLDAKAINNIDNSLKIGPFEGNTPFADFFVESDNVEIEFSGWLNALTHFQSGGQQYVFATVYFDVISGSGEVEITAFVPDNAGNKLSSISRKFNVNEHNRYELRIVWQWPGSLGHNLRLSSPNAISTDTHPYFIGWQPNHLSNMYIGSTTVLHSLIVKSSNPSSGVIIGSSTGHSGITTYTHLIPEAREVKIEAPQYYGWGESRKRFDRWTGDIPANAVPTDRLLSFSINEQKIYTANYVNDPVSPPAPKAGFGWLVYEQGSGLPKGPVTVNIPSGELDSLRAFDGFFIAAADFIKDTLYGVSFETPATLYTMDPETGLHSPVGSTGVSGATGLAYDTVGQILYLTTIEGGETKLYTVDTHTGEVEFITNITQQMSYGIMNKSIAGIAIDTSGKMYGIDYFTNCLYDIDKTTGSANLIGQLGINISYAQDIAYDRDNDLLYGSLFSSTQSDQYQGGLYYICTDNGAAFLLNLFGDEIAGFAIPYIDKPESLFSDVPSTHPFFSEIDVLAASGITTGYDDGTFRPSEPVTRMAMAAFLVRGLKLDQVYNVPAHPTFNDVSAEHPFFEEIELLAASGITEGYDDGTFRPSANVTRMAMAAFLKRGLDLDEEYDVPDELSFTDVLSDHPFYEEIELLAASGISTGWEKDDGYEFRPGQDVTRMAMAAFLVRGLGLED